MILGTPSKLSSQFRLTYNMILNLLRVEALRVEEMIKRSFSENASQRLLPDQQKKVIEVNDPWNLLDPISHLKYKGEKRLSTLQKLDCDICLQDIEDYYDFTSAVIDSNQQLITMAADHPQGSKLLASGRVVILRDGVRTNFFKLNRLC